MRSAALGVHDPLGNPLPVEVLHLLHDVVVVQRGGPVGPTVSENSSLSAGTPESVVVDDAEQRSMIDLLSGSLGAFSDTSLAPHIGCSPAPSKLASSSGPESSGILPLSDSRKKLDV